MSESTESTASLSPAALHANVLDAEPHHVTTIWLCFAPTHFWERADDRGGRRRDKGRERTRQQRFRSLVTLSTRCFFSAETHSTHLSLAPLVPSSSPRSLLSLAPLGLLVPAIFPALVSRVLFHNCHYFIAASSFVFVTVTKMRGRAEFLLF